MAYKISKASYAAAKRLGVSIKPSTVKGKKVDVFNAKGEKIASIGALGMNDFHLWKQKKGIDFAKRRRKAYKMRHEKDRHVRGSAGFYADKILWSLIFITFTIYL
jgi:hypothetical protein